ncbi:MAG: hypothetical protein PHP75_02940, partial [Methylacidiphilaceae bacterium]|nr:hypothetical protein [Candidatus Methylacidiphilaceae bacterium]
MTIASTEWPVGALKSLRSESTKAGRFLLVDRSVNGKGTRMTVKLSNVSGVESGLEATIGL